MKLYFLLSSTFVGNNSEADRSVKTGNTFRPINQIWDGRKLSSKYCNRVGLHCWKVSWSQKHCFVHHFDTRLPHFKFGNLTLRNNKFLNFIICVWKKQLQWFYILFQNETAPPAVILFSIIALEKFAQTTENKITIQKRLQEGTFSSLNIVQKTIKESNSDFIDGENNKLNSIYTLSKGINLLRAFWLKTFLTFF